MSPQPIWALRRAWRLGWLLVVFLLLAACETVEKPYVVDMTRTNSFVPAAPVVPVGATVVWKNRDHMVHSVIFEITPPLFTLDDGTAFGEGGWHSGDITAGDTRAQIFNEAGTYLFYCGYHDEMVGAIIVSDLVIGSAGE
jgi:plastocyanin